MCKHGTTIEVVVRIPAELAFDGVARWAAKPVDSCIARLIQALNDGGVRTLSSCCGHGKGPGSIVLEDGRELQISSGDEQRDDQEKSGE